MRGRKRVVSVLRADWTLVMCWLYMCCVYCVRVFCLIVCVWVYVCCVLVVCMWCDIYVCGVRVVYAGGVCITHCGVRGLRVANVC